MIPKPLALAVLALALAAPAACGRDATAPVERPRTALAPTTLRMEGGAALLELVPDAAVADTAERRRLADLRAAPWVVAVHVARLAADPDTLLVAGRAVAVPVNEHARLVFVGERRTPNAVTRSTSWIGALAGGGRDAGGAIVVFTALGVTASLHVAGPPHLSVGIQPLGASGLHAVVQVDASRFPPD